MLQNLVPPGEELSVITLDPALEQMLIGSLQQSNQAGELIIEPKLVEGLISSVNQQRLQAEENGFPAVLVVAPPIRGLHACSNSASQKFRCSLIPKFPKIKTSRSSRAWVSNRTKKPPNARERYERQLVRAIINTALIKK